MKTVGTLARHVLEGKERIGRKGQPMKDPDRPGWLITAEPHVVLWLKRVLPQISARQTKNLTCPDTIAVCRDLTWILDRFPLEMATDDARHLRERAETQLERERAVQQVLAAGYEPPRFELAEPPREYQRIAAALTLRTGGLLLADDVGLGKTISAIAVLADQRALPALVVTLAHLPRQWERELQRFAPKLRVLVPRKSTPNKREQHALSGLAPPDVVVLNYHKLGGWAPYLSGRFETVIFDEAQELRHDNSAKYEHAKALADSATYRLGLSATPIYNFGGELFNVLNVLRPGDLGSFEEFSREWCGGHMPVDDDDELGARITPGKASLKDPRAFGQFLISQGTMLRRTRKDVGRELPGLSKIEQYVDADKEQLDKIQDRATELARIILQQGETHRGEKFQAAEEISYLVRQATGIAKAPYIAEFVKMLAANGERVLLYAWHREVYAILMERLKDLRPVMFTGSESPKQKQAARDAFVGGWSNVLIMSLRSGAGIDGLQEACRTVVFGELDWSPGVHEQCIGRIYRDGQPEPVAAYFLVADSGSDPVVADALGLKRVQVEGVRNPSLDMVEELQADDGRVKRLAESYLQQRGLDPEQYARPARGLHLVGQQEGPT